MGDRSNLLFKDHDAGVGVYGHWAGTEMAGAAMKVLQNPAFKARVGDPSYATRIGVQTVLEHLKATPDQETGYGIWTPAGGMDDNSYGIIVIDVHTGDLYVTPEESYRFPTAKQLVKDPTEKKIAAAMTKRR